MNVKNVTAVMVIFMSGMIFSQISVAGSKIGILVFDNVLTSDVTAPIEVFGAATKKSWFSNYEVVVIAVDNKEITTEEGLKMIADKTISDAPDIDVLLVPSAYDMSPYLKNKKLIKYLKQTAKQVKWLGSNCSGAFLLAEAGLLDNRNATTWAGGESDLQSQYPKVKVKFNQNVVIDKKIITSNGGAVSYQSALLLLEKLSSKKTAIEIAESIQLPRLKNWNIATH